MVKLTEEPEQQRVREAIAKAKAQAKAEGFRYLIFPMKIGDCEWAAVQTSIINRPVELCDWQPPIFFGKNKLDFPTSVLNSSKCVTI